MRKERDTKRFKRNEKAIAKKGERLKAIRRKREWY